MQARGDDLRNVGPQPAPHPRGTTASPADPPASMLDHYALNFSLCADMLAQIIKTRGREDVPLGPRQIAELRSGTMTTDGASSPREEAIYRFRTETREAMRQWFERALVEARDRAGGAAGELVAVLRRAQRALDALEAAALEAETTRDRRWQGALDAHNEIYGELTEFRPLVATAPASSNGKASRQKPDRRTTSKVRGRGSGARGQAQAAQDWISSADAAKFSGLSTDAMRKRANAEGWPTKRSGRMLLYRKADLQSAWPHKSFDPPSGK